MSDLAYHLAKLRSMGTTNWMTPEFQMEAAITFGAHLDEIEAAVSPSTPPEDVAALVEIVRGPSFAEARKRMEKPPKDYWPVGDVGMVFNALEALAAALASRQPRRVSEEEVARALCDNRTWHGAWERANEVERAAWLSDARAVLSLLGADHD